MSLRSAVNLVVLSGVGGGLVACTSTSKEQPNAKTAASGASGMAGSVGTGAAGGSATGGAETGGSNTGGAATGGSAGKRGGGAGRSGGSGGSGGSSGSESTGGEAGAPVVDNTPSGTPPKLTAGTWVNITPSGVNLNPGCCSTWPNQGFNNNTFGVTTLEIDPSNPYTLYICVDVEGIWKTTDGGTSWKRLGTPPPAAPSDKTVTYIDAPYRIEADPKNPKHLYVTQGVRGATLGFWISEDGGDTWTSPQGFLDATKMATNDVTTMVVDPTDFNHFLLGSHSPWASGVAGIMESRDGGKSFLLHKPADSWTNGSVGIAFYYQPDLKIGNPQSWLVGVDGAGLFRTTDSGDTWTKLSDLGAVHGGFQDIYFTKDGTTYAGANHSILRGTDNGTTWTAVGPDTQDGYYQIIGDGNVLYAQRSNTGTVGGDPVPYYTSPESDGTTWSPYQGGAQMFANGPFMMRFDKVNGILYSANWDAGLWALKVLPP